MVFDVLKKNGIDPATDLTIDQSIDFGLTAAAFTSNDADYTIEFEPFATKLEEEGIRLRRGFRRRGFRIRALYSLLCEEKAIMKTIRSSFRDLRTRYRRVWIM